MKAAVSFNVFSPNLKQLSLFGSPHPAPDLKNKTEKEIKNYIITIKDKLKD